jgi:hypothetical protein
VVDDQAAVIPGGAPTPSSEELEQGRKLALVLRDGYAVRGVLIQAAEAGYITELRCEMAYCFAPERRQFERLGVPLGPWMPSHEHFPLAKRFRGRRDVTNAVLAHRRCNNVGYKIEELVDHLKGLRLADGSSLRAEAIAGALADHVQLRGSCEGRYPHAGASRAHAVKVALEIHASFGITENPA